MCVCVCVCLCHPPRRVHTGCVKRWACGFVCVYVCVRVCQRVCVSVSKKTVYAYLSVCLHFCMCISVCLSVYIRVCVCVCVCLSVCLFVCLSVYRPVAFTLSESSPQELSLCFALCHLGVTFVHKPQDQFRHDSRAHKRELMCLCSSFQRGADFVRAHTGQQALNVVCSCHAYSVKENFQGSAKSPLLPKKT